MKVEKIIGLATFTGLFLLYSFTPDGKEKNSSAIDLSNMDKSVRPQDDFYQFANGGWLKNNPVPSTESRWGSFSALLEENQIRLKGILEENIQKTNASGSNGQKIGDYYFTYMDSIKKNKEGAKPLSGFLKQVENIQSNSQLMSYLAATQLKGVKGVWSIYVSADPKSSNINIAQANQAGLGMPDRDYYLRNDPDSKSLQEKYKQLLVKDFELLGDSKEKATENAEKVYNLEVELAKSSMTNVELRDLEKQYNKWTVAELDAKYPAIKFSSYLKSIGMEGAKEVIIGQPEFFKKANELLNSQPTETWKAYLRWNIINSFSDQLSDEIAQINFDFYGTALSGQKKMKPRWKRAISEVDQMMGEALGQLFVKKYFPEESKKKVDEMVNNLITAYRERINGLDWMSAETKEKAQKKLNTIIKKLGYPNTWKDYSKLTIGRNSHFENYVNAVEFETKNNYEKLPKPVDKMEWFMSPPTVNAYYNPTSNEITFPAGIMQPPFYFSGADDAVNYAAIGAVIGHELTHGFDDQGSQFDEEGNMKDWWTSSDKDRFLSKTKMVVDQFNGYVAIDTLHINGELTLGENIADLGGLSISYAAFQKTAQAKEGKTIDGFTPNQRFFLSWAQIWRTNYTPAALKKQVNTNPHSPGKFRGNGPLTNLPEFYQAFGVKEGDKMWVSPENRAKIW